MGIAGVVFALLGLAVGPFLNTCIERIPAERSVAEPWSRCPVCRRRARLLELVPVCGYAASRRRCAGCGVALPWRQLAVEVLTPVVFGLVWMRYGLTWQVVVAAAYASLFVVLLFIDVEHRLIPNRLVYPAAVLAVATSPLWPELGVTRAIVGGLVGFLVMLVPFLLGGMGGGDVKLGGLIGIMVGFPLVFVALGISILSGGIVAGLLLVAGRKGRKDAIAYGPFLATAGIVTLLYGQFIWDWYVLHYLGK